MARYGSSGNYMGSNSPTLSLQTVHLLKIDVVPWSNETCRLTKTIEMSIIGMLRYCCVAIPDNAVWSAPSQWQPRFLFSMLCVCWQVETFGSMEKKEKVEFILEQMRLCLAKKDFVRTQIISKKINTKYFEDVDTHVSCLLFIIVRVIREMW